MPVKRNKRSGVNAMRRYKESPFVDEMTHFETSTKRVTLKRSADSQMFLINEDGEQLNTSVVVEKQVDSEQFVKIFVNEISSLFDMKPAGQKVLMMLIWVYGTQWKINKDTVALDSYALEDFSEYAKTKGLKVFERRTLTVGINELIKNNVIAAHQKRGWYFINPAFLFSGNRINYVRSIVRNEKLDDKEYNDQMDLLDES